MSQLVWTPLTDGDLDSLVAVAQACLDRDGGLPDLATPERIASLFGGREGIVGRDDLEEVVAVVAMTKDIRGGFTASGLVHPSAYGQGLGLELARWVREHSKGATIHLAMESVSPEAEELFANIGLHRTFSETVMRHDLKHIPFVRLADDLVSLPFTEDLSETFHKAYEQSFQDQPGYDKGAATAWGAWLREQEGFLPEASRVMIDKTGHVVGFVTVSEDWIEEVGVVPAWRGKGVGAHLVVRTLRAMQKRGAERVWLAVGSDNPARSLYERLGFKRYGTRARYLLPGEIEEPVGEAVEALLGRVTRPVVTT